MAKKILRIGTRASALALWQANWVKDELEKRYPELEVTLTKIKTQGDKILDVPLAMVGGKGLFVKEIQEAMLRNEIDIAVHSMKDVPTFFPEGTGLRCITEREDPRDILVLKEGCKSLDDIPLGGRIGTSSLRRKAQLLNLRPDLVMLDIRGNVQTRISKLVDDNLDAVVLAAAGMHRLGFTDQIGAYLDPKSCLPAIGQGALGLESRLADDEINALIDFFNHPATAAAVIAERAVLATLEGGCQVPIAAFGTVDGDQLELTALVSSCDGQQMIKLGATCNIEDAEATGIELAKHLLAEGAGPGDPGLLTIKGRDCLTLADVIVYDYLANPVLLGYAQATAEQIYVGKNCGKHSVPQDEINQLLVDKATAGLNVARLKGGDPYVFGRGGEEAAFLRTNRIPFEVVPGVTAGFAAAAYAGIPLTHRDITTSLALLTGHERPERKLSSLDWEKLATGLGTLIFYMGMSNLKMISENLIKHGRPADTPVAVVQWATLPRQKTLTAPLLEIAERVAEAGIKPPAVIIIGEVVRYREELRWYDNLPLFGKCFLITRPRAQADAFVSLLQAQGAETICIPTIEISAPEDWTACDHALAKLGDYEALILTSANGVEAFFGRMHQQGLDLRRLAGVKIIAVGPKTAKAIETQGLVPDLIPQHYRAEGVIEELIASGVSGKHYLYPRTEIARNLIPDSLTAAGAQVDAPIFYRTIAPQGKREMIHHLLKAGELDAICFSSSSTFDNLHSMFGDELKQLQGETKFFSIGPLTSQSICKQGFEVALEPENSTLDDLVTAMVEYYKKQ